MRNDGKRLTNRPKCLPAQVKMRPVPTAPFLVPWIRMLTGARIGYHHDDTLPPARAATAPWAFRAALQATPRPIHTGDLITLAALVSQAPINPTISVYRCYILIVQRACAKHIVAALTIEGKKRRERTHQQGLPNMQLPSLRFITA